MLYWHDDEDGGGGGGLSIVRSFHCSCLEQHNSMTVIVFFCVLRSFILAIQHSDLSRPGPFVAVPFRACLTQQLHGKEVHYPVKLARMAKSFVELWLWVRMG